MPFVTAMRSRQLIYIHQKRCTTKVKWIIYLVAAKARYWGLVPEGTGSWYLQFKVSHSQAKMVSSRKQVMIKLLIGRKNTLNQECYKQWLFNANVFLIVSLYMAAKILRIWSQLAFALINTLSPKYSQPYTGIKISLRTTIYIK